MACLNATKNLSVSFFTMSQISNSDRHTNSVLIVFNLKADDFMKDGYIIAVILYMPFKSQISILIALP